MVGLKHTKKTASDMFKKIDVNGDGYIELGEFLEFADEINNNEVYPKIIGELQARRLH